MMRETKVFDPADGFAPLTNVVEVTDANVVLREGKWEMFLAGQIASSASTHLFSASLPVGASLSATGWKPEADPNNPAAIALLAPNQKSEVWDGSGGRHCPAYVKGWEPRRREWVERIYYAGSKEQLWGPYGIGYLEWDGEAWVDQPAPVFVASESWERGSVYEPNVLFHEGKWKLWYVAGSNLEDYLVHGYAESEDGVHWPKRSMFAGAELKLFDFAVIEHGGHFEAVFSRVHVAKSAPPAETGLWWCHAEAPGSRLADWSEPRQIMTAEDRGWHSGPWRPCPRYRDTEPDDLLVFFDGLRHTGEPGPFPFAFTVGCLELSRPMLRNAR